MFYVLILLIELSLFSDSYAAQVVPAGTCMAGINFEKSGYSIRAARVESPFSYLRWLRDAITDADRRVSQLNGQLYQNAIVRQKADELENLNFLPEAIEQRVRISLVITSVENCSADQLDIVYSVFTTQIAPVLSSTFESQKAEKVSPESSAGTDVVKNRWRFSPAASYDRAERFSGGAQLGYRAGSAPAKFLPFDSLMVDGRASSSMHNVTSALSGAKDAVADWLDHAEWQVNYLNSSEPSTHAQLRQNRLAGQLSAITRPLGNWQLPLRFGGQLEGGTLRSDFRPAELSHNTLDGSGYGSLKLYLGTTTHLERNVFSASYGIEIGSNRPGSQIGWVKHVGDIAHDVSLAVGDHRSLDIESRLTAGIIQVPGSIPARARFFGGSGEEPFIVGDNWSIRSNPVIRSIPASQFSRTHNGAGGTRFISYNMTASIPFWRKPLIPPEVSYDSEFKEQLNFGLKSATNSLQPEYAAKDSHFKLLAGQIGEVQTALANLQTAVNTAQASRPGQFAQQFKVCTSAINTAKRRAQAAAEANGAAQYGDSVTLLKVSESEDEDRLNKVRIACFDGLNRQIDDNAVAAASATLEQIHSDMEREFSLIDQPAASKQAESEMGYVKRTLNTILYELNFLSLGPVVMFDVAHLGPAESRLGTRYGIGAGLRFTLVSHVNFTIGYVANPKRIASEHPGAFFFSMRFKDLLE
jgi:hypothetical protein